jgi:hypothetical protein
MKKYEKVLSKILSGVHDKNVDFVALCYLLQRYGFQQRIKGDHHIFYKSGIEEILNLQPKGKLAKPYQVKQVRAMILKYKFGETDE